VPSTAAAAIPPVLPERYRDVVQNPGYLNESIINPDGSVSRYQYTNFVVFLTDHGQISRDKVVTLKLEGMASDKVAIS